jgi:hydrogenase nickel incorporation protein HypB
MHDIITMDIGESVFAENRKIAKRNHVFLEKHSVRSFDFLGAVGSGKTMLIEQLGGFLRERGIRTGVIAGDVAGDDDYKRFKKAGLQAANINTGKECHLDAHMVEHTLEDFDLESVDVLFIENVGNLVCPVDFPLGADMRVVVISTTEGDDMIRKHPAIFRDADFCILNKIDLANAIGMDPNVVKRDFSAVNNNSPFLMTNARDGEGVTELADAFKIVRRS